MREKEAGLEEEAGLGNQMKCFFHVACRLLSGGAVPQTPGQGGVHEQFPLNNPPRFGVIYANSDNLLVLVWRWFKGLWAAYLSR